MREKMMKRFSWLLVLVSAALVLPGACTNRSSSTTTTTSNVSYAKDVEKWRQERLDRLRSENGWLTLIGLDWLKPGENRIGTDEKTDRVVLPAGKAPAFVGTLLLDDKQTVRLRPAKGVALTIDGKPAPAHEVMLRKDVDVKGDEKPTLVGIGTLRFHIIVREDKVGVRLRDTQSPARQALTRLDHFPVDSRWRFHAKFEPYKPPRKLQYMNIIGQLETDSSPGAAVFTVNGEQYRLDATQDPDTKELSFVFADQTNGRETYGGGRFLDTPPPTAGGTVDLDFNKAYSPPCSFTPYATCPLPAQENRLPIRIEAGEKSSAHHNFIAQNK